MWQIADYSRMLQNPQLAFREESLRKSRIHTDSFGQPVVCSGAFAAVFKATLENKKNVAVRAFTSRRAGLEERYRAVSEYLDRHNEIKSLVWCRYLDKGVLMPDGRRYPLVVMDWIAGETLYHWLRQRCQVNDTAALHAAADRWFDLIGELAKAKIAHGDLQHDNILVTPDGELKLVDYDCLCVPALEGQLNPESGLPPYQHPSRSGETLLSPALDRFSALFIYVVLRALAAAPSLWQRHIPGTGGDYEKLLIRSDDFEAPDRSALFRDMLDSPDAEVISLTERLIDFYRQPTDKTPPLYELTDRRARPDPSSAKGDGQTLLARRQQAWKEIEKTPSGLSAKSDWSLHTAWSKHEKLFEGWDVAEEQRPRLTAARRRLGVYKMMNGLVKSSPAPPSLEVQRQIAELAAKLPAEYEHPLAERAYEAACQVSAYNRVQQAAAPPVSDVALARAFEELKSAGGERFLSEADLRRCELAQRRSAILQTLGDLPGDLPLDRRDLRILELWDDSLLVDCQDAEPWRRARQAALARRAAVDEMVKAMTAHDYGKVVAISQSPCFREGLPPAAAAQVEIAVARTKEAEEILRAVRSADVETFARLFDVQKLHQHRDALASHERVMLQFTQQHLLTCNRLGLRRARGVSSLAHTTRGLRVRWIWPARRFSDRCLAAACFAPPEWGDDPLQVAAAWRLEISHSDYERGGGVILPEDPALHEYSIVVWSIIDVWEKRLYSEPLILGKVADAPGGKRKR